MKKKSIMFSLASTALLAPALLANHVLADGTTADEMPPVSRTEITANPATVETDKDVVILHTNDVHGRIVEEKNRNGETTVIGDAKLAAVLEEESAKTDQHTLVVDAGDAFQGLPISNSSKGEERAKILNEMNYDAMAVGNHEFDFGLGEVKKYKEILNFPLLSTNTYINGARLFEAYTIVDKDKTVKGDEFVVIGVTTPETATKTHPKNVEGVEFRDPVDEVNKVIAEIEAKAAAVGAEYKNYVILAHLGVDSTTPVAWRGSTLAEALAANEVLKGKRVVVIDGHSHTVESKPYGTNVTYNQTGSYLHNVGKVTYKTKDLLGNPTQITAKSVTNTVPNAKIEALVKQIKDKYDAENAKVVVENSPVELSGDRENVRVRETNLGNIVADALYDYGQTGFAHKSHLAVTNGGGLRETIAKDKPITKGSIIAVLPFGNIISQITVTGQNIQDMFTKSLGSILQVDQDGKPVLDQNGQPLLEASGGFLQISGAKVYYDTNLPAEKRVLGIEIKDPETGKYEPLDLTKTYYLATNDFLAAGGDGYTMLGGAREEGPSMDEVFADFLKTAKLEDYADVNPNRRTISISQADYEKMLQQGKDENPNEDLPNPGGVELPSRRNRGPVAKPAVYGAQANQMTYAAPKASALATATATAKSSSKNALPETGSKDSALLSIFGASLALLGLAGMKKTEDK
ncbi:cell surface ecto-5'-nucleotidase Nt5e [Streptococcus himalayensis]|uniref:Multifunctional 2',3'-cyclic-nucleotide 2'-phosphodiesterase/5'-nucleotidase/3'-nucleotidase n=1 Tax=Streptococcus himalayensis TaxID=1888195 RepID=A0A917A5L6_9STRE|nr:cell surface ecto-5'-nucleotidase Nt5e [Streptococcus himalayensis]GGE27731.1 multifunctional 2',3'-cyclic-nucleotide 2'-phosphodiesterase/5'-nucleotidase/3'-nucleotidase [Streptococcus himalayensis]